MKKNKLYLLLLIPTIILVMLYLNIRSKTTVPSDLYEIAPNFFLQKIDYFSNYNIVKLTDSNSQTIVSNVQELNTFSEGFLVKFKSNSTEKFLYFSTNPGTPIVADNLDELLEVGIIPSVIIWEKPWQIVESKTIESNTKLTSQIVLLLIILLLFYMTMKFFNLKQITKSP